MSTPCFCAGQNGTDTQWGKCSFVYCDSQVRYRRPSHLTSTTMKINPPATTPILMIATVSIAPCDGSCFRKVCCSLSKFTPQVRKR